MIQFDCADFKFMKFRAFLDFFDVGWSRQCRVVCTR